MHHFVEAGRDQARQADHVDLFLDGSFQNSFAGDHHAQVDDFVVVAAEHHADDVLADVVHVAFDGGQQHLAAHLLRRGAGLFLFLFHEGQQIGHGFFHHAGAFDHLRQEHLARAEQIADDLHAGHQRTFDDVEAAGIFLPGFFGVLFDEFDDAFDQGVAEAFFDRALAPGQGSRLA